MHTKLWLPVSLLLIALVAVGCDGAGNTIVQQILNRDGVVVVGITDNSRTENVIATDPDSQATLDLIGGKFQIASVKALKEASALEDLSNVNNVNATYTAAQLTLSIVDAQKNNPVAVSLNTDITPQLGNFIKVVITLSSEVTTCYIRIKVRDVADPLIGAHRMINSQGHDINSDSKTNKNVSFWGERFTLGGWVKQRSVNLYIDGGVATPEEMVVSATEWLNHSMVADFANAGTDYPAGQISIASVMVTLTGQIRVITSATPSTQYVNRDVAFNVTTLITPAGYTGSVAYSWNFADGSPNSNLAAPTHQFTTANVYNVVCTVTGNGCSGNGNVNVTINPLGSATVTGAPSGSFWRFTLTMPASYTGLNGDKTKLQFNYQQTPIDGTPIVYTVIIDMHDRGDGIWETDHSNVPYELFNDPGTFKWWIKSDQGVTSTLPPGGPDCQVIMP